MSGFGGQHAPAYPGSDGFADQFGGPAGKRFKTGELKHLILDSCNVDLQVQQRILESTLDKWINNFSEEPYEQIDDITLLAFEV